MRCKRAIAFHTGESAFFKVDEVIAMSFVKYPGISQKEERFLYEVFVLGIPILLFLLLRVLHFSSSSNKQILSI